ncbi:nucleotidyltransferase domain-containing protein [Saccharopolyspora hirsuta]|uniref:Nucleotidyltransferase domain-containing protein n=1 Tax=Saccharopolyspora hirsuta TaxID=1837 RepID=A0A5M7BU03_SACHI|nr:nucleotidyltransferase domain-containing protein [Saccharopolyspora hirsuta]
MADSATRRARADRVVAELLEWADTCPDVEALALVGSYARPPGAETDESDVDIVVVTADPDRYTGSTENLPPVLELPLLRAEQWGPVAERRLRHAATGLVVELNITTPVWAATDPEVDSGTRRVVGDGIRVLRDPEGLLARLIDVVRGDRSRR